jgi:ParB family transcriptional regulator, chromosome partitioning protein
MAVVKVPTYEKGQLYQLSMSLLTPDPEQPRKFFDEQALAELQASIVSHGVLQPVLVREGGDGIFIIVSGERRYQAAKNAGLETIPAILTDGEPAEISIIENLLRENFTAIEETEAIERLQTLHDYGLAELATALGKSDSAISEILSLNRLPAEVKDDCRNDPKASRKILAIIARERTPDKMLALYTKYKASGLTRGEIIKQAAKPKLPKVPMAAQDIAAFCELLDVISDDGHTTEQKTAINLELVKLRSVAYQKMKLFKV